MFIIIFISLLFVVVVVVLSSMTEILAVCSRPSWGGGGGGCRQAKIFADISLKFAHVCLMLITQWTVKSVHYLYA